MKKGMVILLALVSSTVFAQNLTELTRLGFGRNAYGQYTLLFGVDLDNSGSLEVEEIETIVPEVYSDGLIWYEGDVHLSFVYMINKKEYQLTRIDGLMIVNTFFRFVEGWGR